MFQLERQRLIDAVALMVERGAISPGHFANLSVRLPDDVVLLTSPDSLSGIRAEDMAIVGLDNVVRAGYLREAVQEIVPMHTAIYKRRPDVRAVVHSHSPYATAFALANRPIPCSYIEMTRFDLYEGVPVAPYAPRGSPDSVDNVTRLVGPKSSCVLLQNHGVLTYAATLEEALSLAVVLEEGAHMVLLATALGGATVIPRPRSKGE